MPTYDVFASLWRDWRNLTPQQHLAFVRGQASARCPGRLLDARVPLDANSTQALLAISACNREWRRMGGERYERRNAFAVTHKTWIRAATQLTDGPDEAPLSAASEPVGG